MNNGKKLEEIVLQKLFWALVIVILVFGTVCDISATETDVQEQTESEEGELQLDPNQVKHKKKSYTTLTDLYGLDIFTEEFEKKMQQYKEMEEKKIDNTVTNVFSEEDCTEKQIDELCAKIMSSETSLIINSETNKETTQKQTNQYIFVGLFLGVGCIIYVIIDRVLVKRRKSGEDNINYDKYEVE